MSQDQLETQRTYQQAEYYRQYAARPENRERHRKAARKYRERHREAIAAAGREYYAENKDRIKERGREHSKQYRLRNPEKVKASARKQSAKYYAANRQRLIAESARWNKENLERRREIANKSARLNYKGSTDKARQRAREYAAANREAAAEKSRLWRQNNKDHAHALQLSYRARKKGARVQMVRRSFLLKRDKGICGICHTPVDPKKFHVDHIISLANGGEHSYANTQIAHPSCNCRKGRG